MIVSCGEDWPNPTDLAEFKYSLLLLGLSCAACLPLMLEQQEAAAGDKGEQHAAGTECTIGCTNVATAQRTQGGSSPPEKRPEKGGGGLQHSPKGRA